MAGCAHIGTSGWSYSHWIGPFYPVNADKRHLLAHYCERFDTVEVNSSFYHLPTTETIVSWRETTAPSFRFAVKASRYITHMKKLRDPEQTTPPLLEHVSQLQEKLAPILFQLPPNWKPNPERLGEFLDSLPPGFRYVFEFRNNDWFCEPIIALLRSHHAGFCIYDLGGKTTPLQITSDIVYIRLHGSGPAYAGSYSDSCLLDWAARIREWAEAGHEVYCYFDNDIEACAPKDAQRLRACL